MPGDADFKMLGPLELSCRGEVVALDSRRQLTLLAILLVRANEVVSSDTLIESIWGDDSRSIGIKTLRSHVSKLRRTLRASSPAIAEKVVTQAPGYRLDVDPEDVDAGRFEMQLVSARRIVGLAPAEAVPMFAEALAQWRGPALADFAFDEFAQSERVRLEELRIAALTDRIGAELASGPGVGITGEVESLLVAHPTHERLWAHLMIALYRDGRTRDALEAFRRACTSLADAGLSPSEFLSSVEAKVLADDLSLRAPVEVTSTGLPAPVTTPIGRTEDIGAVVSALHARRLVTLVGPGGVGKTTIALEAAHLVADSDGEVVWVDLAVLGNDRQIVGAVAAVAGVQVLPGHDVAEALRRHLRRGPALLVLDNCEHLLPGVAGFVSDVLSACPDLVVLTTSRESLRATGEKVTSIPPLPVPRSAHAPLGDSAVALFEARVRDLDDEFVPTQANREAFVEICRALDGMPLAIELAATRMRVMTASELAARLDDRFSLLASDRRDSIERHSSLEATVRWSYDLLDERERLLLDRLSVFAGPFSLDAAQRICGFGGLSADDIVDVLAALVSKSLVVHRVGSGVAGFRLLETIREWASRSLNRRGEADDVADRHAAYWVAWIGGRPADTDGLTAFHAVEAEVFRAMDHLITSERYSRAAEFLWSSSMFCELSSHDHEIEAWARRLLPHVDSMDPIPRAGILLYSSADPRLADFDRAVGRLERAIDVYESVGACACAARNVLGIRFAAAGMLSRAIEQYDAAIERHVGECTAPIWIHRMHLGVALARLGRSDEARVALAQGVADADAAGLAEYALPEFGLAIAASCEGRIHEARELLAETIASLVRVDLEDSCDYGRMSGALASIELQLRELGGARQHVKAALECSGSWSTICGVPTALAVAAALAEEGGAWHLAAHLEGGIASWISTTRIVLPDETLHEIVDRDLAEARSPLDAIGFERAWGGGVGASLVDLSERYLEAHAPAVMTP